MRDGRACFDIDVEVDGDNYGMEIWADGRVREADIPVDRLPAGVRTAVTRAVEGIDLRDAKLDTDGDDQVFRIDGRAGRDRYEFRVSPGGRVEEMELPTARVPEAVRAAAVRAVEGLKLGRTALRVMRGDQPVYVLDGRARGDDREVALSVEGRVLAVDPDDEFWDVDDARGPAPDAAPRNDAGVF
jgi:hypothetical protein